jgi:hypothetical protein
MKNVRIASIPVDTQTEHLLNTYPEHYTKTMNEFSREK